jgi:DNA-binding GntR family transcriptional regulator
MLMRTDGVTAIGNWIDSVPFVDTLSDHEPDPTKPVLAAALLQTPRVSGAPTMKTAPPSAAAQSKSERVYLELRRRIREVQLPPGAPLRREDIADELGVSRAPVSEAIARLADEALVDIFPQHGSFVAPIRADDVRESLFIRTALEVEAVRHATENATPALLAALDENIAFQAQALRKGDFTAFYELDEALHALIFGSVESARLSRLLNAARAPLDRPRRIALPEEGRPESTLAEHRRIVDAIRTQDPEFAAAAMRIHMGMVARGVESQLSQVEANARNEAAEAVKREVAAV